jgi:2-polyprenyl-6-methoxyphenol hydroxylase-like FAD-dependent oxidoreductase
MTQLRAVVIGGGIGGLTAANALHRDGWHTTVLERAPSLEPVGAGIGLAPNGQRALDTIGLGDTVRELAAWQGDGRLATPSGRVLARLSAEAIAHRFGGPMVLLHRATLVGLLTSRLPGGTVRTGTPARLADHGDPAGRPALVTVPGGELEAELVVAADGARSAVREALFPGHSGPRYSGLTTWRFVVPDTAGPFEPHETWGRGGLWGSHPLKDGRIYAYAAAAVPAGGRAPDDEHAELLRRFGDWHHPVPALLAAVTPGHVLRHDVYHQTDPLPAFHRGRTALLGDAAHAMSPNLAQGGNQAIEDAVVLAHHLAFGADRAAGLAAYSAERLPRTTAVVRRAARAASAARIAGPAGTAVRDLLVRAVSRTGPGLVLRGFDGIADWWPPARPYAGTAGNGRA